MLTVLAQLAPAAAAAAAGTTWSPFEIMTCILIGGYVVREIVVGGIKAWRGDPTAADPTESLQAWMSNLHQQVGQLSQQSLPPELLAKLVDAANRIAAAQAARRPAAPVPPPQPPAA
jgi:hypothetical protein